MLVMLPRTRWSICVSMELSLSGDVDRAFRGKAEKASPKISRPLRSSELSLPGDVDRGFRGKLRKPCPRYPIP
jgi:hypothetical protein